MNFYHLDEQICNEGLGTWYRITNVLGSTLTGGFKGVDRNDYQKYKSLPEQWKKMVADFVEKDGNFKNAVAQVQTQVALQQRQSQYATGGWRQQQYPGLATGR